MQTCLSLDRKVRLAVETAYRNSPMPRASEKLGTLLDRDVDLPGFSDDLGDSGDNVTVSQASDSELDLSNSENKFFKTMEGSPRHVVPARGDTGHSSSPMNQNAACIDFETALTPGKPADEALRSQLNICVTADVSLSPRSRPGEGKLQAESIHSARSVFDEAMVFQPSPRAAQPSQHNFPGANLGMNATADGPALVGARFAMHNHNRIALVQLVPSGIGQPRTSTAASVSAKTSPQTRRLSMSFRPELQLHGIEACAGHFSNDCFYGLGSAQSVVMRWRHESTTFNAFTAETVNAQHEPPKVVAEADQSRPIDESFRSIACGSDFAVAVRENGDALVMWDQPLGSQSVFASPVDPANKESLISGTQRASVKSAAARFLSRSSRDFDELRIDTSSGGGGKLKKQATAINPSGNAKFFSLIGSDLQIQFRHAVCGPDFAVLVDKDGGLWGLGCGRTGVFGEVSLL